MSQYTSCTEEVDGHALSEYLKEFDLTKLKLIKIDIEGSEIEALVGLKNLIAKHPAEIVCELNEHCLLLLGHTLDGFWDVVQELSCDLFELKEDAALAPIRAIEELREVYPKNKGQHMDVLLRPRSGTGEPLP